MKISVSFTLLLLLGAVPASESQQTYPPDINTVLTQMAAWLVQMKADMITGQAQLQTQLDTLKQQQLVQQVAFSASLVVAGESRIGPVTLDTTLIYKYVPTNIGNAYNSNTGDAFRTCSGGRDNGHNNGTGRHSWAATRMMRSTGAGAHNNGEMKRHNNWTVVVRKKKEWGKEPSHTGHTDKGTATRGTKVLPHAGHDPI
ncbi:uncharacterized protein LOC120544166 isoform X2 [Perca fluviatilis]|uniref:uncharacterized protein LOC120544166 isoform X2 n=1 Tax=Perca fluviatilis TaxID=8168 RepID=UPI0019659F41|nr:uncharacterized protein LOC120544166 isoform X2 [Perca fluviatilis]